MSHADLPVRRAPFSILSSPVSASDVRWPTSVMFITWRTRVAVPAQHALQHVLEQERAEVADVLVVVDGRAAGVEADRRIRGERLESRRERV